ncbi:MAG: glycosyltransferase family 1 protein [Burkholderia sp.]|nr:MAG: hypothetical protein E5299_00927 [Burkholderia gladioli]
MLKIFLDVTRLMSRLSKGLLPTGVDRVGLAYIERYGADAQAVFSHAGFARTFSRDESRRIFDMLLSGSCAREPRLLSRLGSFGNWLDLRRSPGVLLHISHNGIEHARYYTWMNRRAIRPVFMIHDLIPLTHAEYCRPGVDTQHRCRVHMAIRHAGGLIANSRATLDALAVEAASASLTLPPCVVAKLAPGITPGPSRTSEFSSPYFVTLGTIEPRKNHWLLLHVWRRMVEQLGNAAPKLVIVGRRGWECENVVDMLERCATLKGVVEEINCSDEWLYTLLQHARALLFPSFVEGYGMPLVEALMIGVPVIASDLAVFHEIASEIPDYLDPLDGRGWLARILAYTEVDSAERASQLSRIASFEPPTWSDHFQHVDRFIASLFE